MAQAKGSNTKIVVGIESAYGTLATFSTASTADKVGIIIPYSNFNVKNAENKITNSLIRGSRNPVKPARGNKNPSGTLSTLLTPFMYPLFAYTLGKRKVADSLTDYIVVTNSIYSKGSGGTVLVNNNEGYTTTGENLDAIVSPVETAPYIHTFSIGEIPSFSLEAQYAGLTTASYRRFLGCCVNSMKLTFPVEGYVGLDLDIMAAEETVETAAMAAGTELEYESRPYDVFELVAAHVMIGTPGTAETSMTSLAAVAYIDSISDITISNNLGGEGYVLGGGGTRKALPAGVVTVSGSIKAMFTDASAALLLAANNNTEKSILLTLVRGTTTLAAPGTTTPKVGQADNEAIQIIIPEIVLSATSPTIDGPTGIYFEGAFNAYYEDSTIDGFTSGIQIKVVNSSAPRL